MNQGIFPAMAPFFAKQIWSDVDVDQLKRELMKAIAQDPEITKKDNISVLIEEKTASDVKAIGLVGEVDSEKDRERAEQVVRVNTKNQVTVDNQLKLANSW